MPLKKKTTNLESDISRTSQVVALNRANFDRPHSAEGDPEAQKRLCIGMQPTRLIWPMLERTRFFDEQVQSAISLGISQVVICGAGYDDRALRFRTEGVRFFELDHPVTQADKLRRLKSMDADMEWLTLVPIDFCSDDVEAKLSVAGHDAGCPTLFVCEGLLVYLNQQVGCKLLAGLRSRAAVGSVLAASLAVHPEGADSDKVAAAVNTRRRAGKTEPWLTILSVNSYLALFKQTGWKISQNIDSLKIDTREIHGGMPLITAKPIFDPSEENKNVDNGK